MITAIILAKNEEKNIIDCLESVSFCDEIIVIDDGSTDLTVPLAKKAGAKVIFHTLDNDFAKQRNFGLSKATHEWVFFIDADERVSPPLREEIVSMLANPVSVSGYYIRRLDYMWGKLLRHGETGDLYFLRLAKKHAGKWMGKVHETWVSQEQTAELEHPLYHYPHVTVSEFLTELNFYSTLRADELYQQQVHTTAFQIAAYPIGKFLVNYIGKKGFLDATPGLLFAILMSLHSFLVRGKLWQLWEKQHA